MPQRDLLRAVGEEEGTRTLMPAVREVIEQQGIFCALYSDRASHFFLTPKAGGKVDEKQVTQLGRALQEFGIKMIPSYSPQARGRMERSYRIWQGRLPQELFVRQITTVEEANRFLREEYRAELTGALRSPQPAKAAGLSARGGRIWRGCSRSSTNGG